MNVLIMVLVIPWTISQLILLLVPYYMIELGKHNQDLVYVYSSSLSGTYQCSVLVEAVCDIYWVKTDNI